MKRVIALLLCLMMLLASCAPAETPKDEGQPEQQMQELEAAPASEAGLVWTDDIPAYSSYSDAGLLGHVEDMVYRETVSALGGGDYFVENVSAVYISREYLDEVSFNAQANLYFGYTLAELDEVFQGSRYVFTLGEDGRTTVQELQTVEGMDTEAALVNLAIGGGVLLICVTVAGVAGAVGAAEVSILFAVAAESGTLCALRSGAFGALTEGIMVGMETGDFDAALEAAALHGSEEFKWGAISGVLGSVSEEAEALRGILCQGLSLLEAAGVQSESGFPLDVIKQFQNMGQYETCRDAGLTPQMLNGETALVRDIDLDAQDGEGRTNLERMSAGLAALDGSGSAYQLCRIGEDPDATLAILTEAELQAGGGLWQPVAGGAGAETEAQAFWQAVSRSAAAA